MYIYIYIKTIGVPGYPRRPLCRINDADDLAASVTCSRWRASAFLALRLKSNYPGIRPTLAGAQLSSSFTRKLISTTRRRTRSLIIMGRKTTRCCCCCCRCVYVCVCNYTPGDIAPHTANNHRRNLEKSICSAPLHIHARECQWNNASLRARAQLERGAYYEQRGSSSYFRPSGNARYES